MEPELVLFVRESLAQGLERSAVRQALLDAEWPPDEVGKALDAFADRDFPVPVPRPRPYLSAREAFVYLVLFLTLYISAISLGTLAFQLIGRALPDATADAWFWESTLQTIRWSLASLVIALPVFLPLQRRVLIATQQDPERRGSRIRKWLSYLTLFVAAAVLICDLITLVYNLLGGELTTRFVSKVGVVALIAGGVFSFYLWDLRQEESDEHRPRVQGALPRIFGVAAIVASLLAIVPGLFAVGSPSTARARQLDRMRVADLAQIAIALDRFEDDNDRLPESLEELSRDRTVFLRSTEDPATGAPYEYRVVSESRHELCATFDRVSERRPADRSRRTSDFWSHGAGRSCFEVDVRAP